MKKIFVAAAFLFPVTVAHAFDSISAEAGHGTRGVDMWRLGLQWKQEPAWLAGHRTWSLYWDTAIGAWEGDTGSLTEGILTPTFRYGHEHGPYLDGGIGFHVLSETRISSTVEFSTRFQFGDHVGAGYRFGRHDLSMRIQHLSNAGIKNPNPGINFLQIRLQYWMD
ncbi:MAG TPA: acyloxyacyl hydrolase [Burkholderiales bacterium]|nr:acyloxyacyl hydrolase [Burkholderiales bacterium]